jgi:acetyl esterase/lipase
LMMRTTRRQLMVTGIGAGMGGLLTPVPGWATEPRDRALQFVHPELRTYAKAIMDRAAKDAPLSLATLAAKRDGQSRPAFPLLDTPPVQKQVVRGAPSLPEVQIYVVNARPGTARPAIVEMHGGGFIMGSAQRTLSLTQKLAAELDCVIISVDYRLAPETIFAGAIEDTYSALKWLHDHASELGVDPQRIAVMGGSAGGGHAALLAQTAYDRGEVPICFQCLTYAMLDDRTGSSRTPNFPIGAVGYTAPMNAFSWRCFLGQAPGTSKVPVRAVPARRRDLKGLPPAFIGVGSIDLFVDEDLEYATRLIDAGIPTQVDVVPGAFHAFELIAPNTDVGSSFAARRVQALRRAFERAAT